MFSNTKLVRKKCDGKIPVCGGCKSRGEDYSCENNLMSVSCGTTGNTQVEYKTLLDDGSQTLDDGSQTLEDATSNMIFSENNSIKAFSISNGESVVTEKELNSYEFSGSEYESEDSDSTDTLSKLLQVSTDKDANRNFPLDSNLITPFKCFLSDEGVLYLDFFYRRVSKLITIGPDRYNHLLNTFMPLAMTSAPIQLALSTWGNSSLLRSTDQEYMKRSMDLAFLHVQRLYKSPRRLERETFYELLCFFVIAMSTKISSGDTFYWKQFLSLSQKFIQEYGSLKTLLSDLSFSNEIKWILSDIQYHADLSNDPRLFDNDFMDEYYDLIEKTNLFQGSDFGIDPSQGCLQPMYFTLRKINKQALKLEKKWDKIDNIRLRSKDKFPSENLAFLKREFYNHLMDVSDFLDRSIEECRPIESQVSALVRTESEIGLHMDLFELHRLVCFLYVLLRIRKIPPCSPAPQRLLIEAIEKIKTLYETRMATCLAFPYLICGLTCCDDDRNTMREILEEFIQRYPIRNIKHIYLIVKKFWEDNPRGDLCLNWYECTKKNGSDVCFS